MMPFRAAAMLLVGCSLLCVGCGEKTRPANLPLLKENLYGRWKNVYLRLEMKTFGGSDTTRVFEVHEKEWASKMGLRPILTYLWAGGAYNALHYDLMDSLVKNPAGVWSLHKDSIYMTDTFPQKALTFKYQVRLFRDSMVLTGMEDLDGDGMADDLYTGAHTR